MNDRAFMPSALDSVVEQLMTDGAYPSARENPALVLSKLLPEMDDADELLARIAVSRNREAESEAVYDARNRIEDWLRWYLESHHEVAFLAEDMERNAKADHGEDE